VTGVGAECGASALFDERSRGNLKKVSEMGAGAGNACAPLVPLGSRPERRLRGGRARPARFGASLRDTCRVGVGRLGASLSVTRAFCPRMISPRPKLSRGALRAVADDGGGRLAILPVVLDECTPEVALIAFRVTLDTFERHVRLQFRVLWASRRACLSASFSWAP
jgi:hypothetical protein